MSVIVSAFDRLSDGRSIEKITLTNHFGTSVSLLSLGAALQAFVFEGKDIVLGFDKAEDYFQSGAYIGATVGRVCNRTADGRFLLNGKEYTLTCNEAERHGHLHGGMVGFDKKVWSYAVSDENTSVRFFTESADGEEGYPGNLQIAVEYTLTEDNRLMLDYTAATDADTPLNMTNHAYFNLNGCDGDTIHNTVLHILAEEYTPVNERLIPTGEYAPVAGTAIDFRAGKRIGDALAENDATMTYTGGVDHNFVLAHNRRDLTKAAEAYSAETGIRLQCWTDLPGIQVYTANFLDEQGGKYGLKWKPHQGFCLETQFFANSVNQPNFPSIILKAGETFRSRTVYGVEKTGEVK